MEFAVNLSCENCVTNIRNQLEGVKGIKDVHVSLENQSVVLNSSLPSFKVQQLIEKTGKKAILKGYGSEEGKANLGSAVAQLAGETGFSCGILKGVVRFVQSNAETCVIEGTIDGLKSGPHRVQVHECGDISRGCDSVGELFNFSKPLKTASNGSSERLAGNLGSIKADADGRAEFRFEDSILKVWDIIGRSLVIVKPPIGSSGDASRSAQDAGEKLACAIIARSAGLLENSKKICACDGVSIWDEQNKPLTGPGRRIGDPEKSENKTNRSLCSIG